jgi:choline kinase
MGMSEFKCVILAGGLGTRISEETALRPKPMVEIGVHGDTPSHVERLAP